MVDLIGEGFVSRHFTVLVPDAECAYREESGDADIPETQSEAVQESTAALPIEGATPEIQSEPLPESGPTLLIEEEKTDKKKDQKKERKKKKSKDDSQEEKRIR